MARACDGLKSSIWFGGKEGGFQEVEVAQDVPAQYKKSHLGSNTGR